MKLRATLAAGLLAVLGLVGCQTWGPSWSELSGSRYNVTALNKFPASILYVDGSLPGPRQGYGGYSFYKIEPGKHVITLAAINTTPNWVPGINRLDFPFDVEPCKRYYINSEFANPLLTEWRPVIDYVEPIPGCSAGGTGGATKSGY